MQVLKGIRNNICHTNNFAIEGFPYKRKINYLLSCFSRKFILFLYYEQERFNKRFDTTISGQAAS